MTQTLQTLTVKESIESRHSIRKYEDEPVAQEDLEEILRLTSLAPSAWNVQPWRFVVVRETGLRKRLQEAAYGQPQVTAAPVVIVVTSDMEDVLDRTDEIPHPGMGLDARNGLIKTIHDTFGPQSVEERGLWGLTQTNIAMGFLMIAAQSLGYATCPMLGFDQGKVRELLRLKEHVKFGGLVTLGVPAEKGYSHHRHSLDRIVTYH